MYTSRPSRRLARYSAPVNGRPFATMTSSDFIALGFLPHVASARALLATPTRRVSDGASAAGNTLINRADDKLARQYAPSRGAIVLHAGLSVSAEYGAAALRIQLIAWLRRGIPDERHAERCRQRMEHCQSKAQRKRQSSHHGSSPFETVGIGRDHTMLEVDA